MSDFFKKNNSIESAYGLGEGFWGSDEYDTITNSFLDEDKSLGLKFDGKKFSLVNGDDEILSWPAVSGKEGYQSSEYQNIKGMGPIPEGNYEVRQDKYSSMNIGSDILGTYYPKIRRNLPEIIREFMPPKLGSWSGGSKAWGTQKINLVPDTDQEMYGRDGFFIHGGEIPGSAGCIDLTNNNDNFMGTFLSLGRDLPLQVIYEKNKENKNPTKK